MALQLVERLSVVRGRDDGPRRQMIPIEVGNGPDVADVIENDVILALACFRILSLRQQFRLALMVLEGAEVEAGVGWRPVRPLLLKDVAVAALATDFCMLRSARGALKLFVLHVAEVPEQQGITARCQVVPAEICEFDDVHF